MTTVVATPRINTNDDKVGVVHWHVAEGDYVDAGQDVVDLETSKAVVTISADTAGFVKPLGKKGSVLKVGAPLYICAPTVDGLAAAVPAATPAAAKANTTARAPANAPLVTAPNAAPALPTEFGLTRFSRAALQLMAERGLSEKDFAGAGLVTARTVTGAGQSEAPAALSVAQPSPAIVAPALMAAPATPREESVSLGKLAEIETLSTGEAGNINSMLTVTFPSQAIRDRLAAENAFDGSIQPLILFELSRLLKKWPQFTAFFDDDAIHYYDRIDLGVAFDLGAGLKVVTYKDADKMMPIDFFERTIDVGLRYLDNRLRPDELVGSTLTVTDLSGFNILYFHPLINGRQAAIIGLGADIHQPGYPMSITMTFDHRVSNGREVGTFLNELRDRLLAYAPQTFYPAEPTYEVVEAIAYEPEALPIAVQACDTCGVPSDEYYEAFGTAAYLLAYFRPDGSMGAVCHRCHGGY